MHPDRQREKYRSDPVFRQAMLDASRRNRTGLTSEQKRSRHYAAKFGVTYEWVLSLLEKQSNTCAMCTRPLAGMGRGPSKGSLDHCHVSGRIRGILCGKCNTSLGHYERVAEMAGSYLVGERSQPQGLLVEVAGVSKPVPTREYAADIHLDIVDGGQP